MSSGSGFGGGSAGGFFVGGRGFFPGGVAGGFLPEADEVPAGRLAARVAGLVVGLLVAALVGVLAAMLVGWF